MMVQFKHLNWKHLPGLIDYISKIWSFEIYFYTDGWACGVQSINYMNDLNR